ncbi:response regulator transcription factor [Leucobacter allii]|uniref:helix-turn-helix transcriptional regulator n=1 Tax=Leucobacter allii TaxID=2932247 RepID=UPI003D283BCF
MLLLRARQWLRDPGVVAEAERIAAWASDEELALIELQARHTHAYAVGACSTEELRRATELAGRVDPALGAALLGHLERIGTRAGPRTAASDPEASRLADFGIWLPLPPAPELTAREREIVLLAAVGHSSRLIAERLHISARTVETHLGHAFAKLGVSNRDELRGWATRHRATLIDPGNT